MSEVSDRYCAVAHFYGGKASDAFTGTYAECLVWLARLPQGKVLSYDVGHVVAEFFPEPDAVPPF